MISIYINCEEFKDYTLEQRRKLIKINIEQLINKRNKNKKYEVVFDIKQNGQELKINLDDINNYNVKMKDFNLKTSKIILSI